MASASNGNGWLRRRRVDAALNTAAVLAAAGAPVLASQAGPTTGAPRALLLSGAAACAAAVVLIGALIQHQDRRRLRTAEQVAVDAEAELATALNGALAPITSYLAEMADTPGLAGRSTIAGELRQAVVEAAVRLTAADARSAYYAADLPAGLLTRQVYAGRSAQPRPTFIGGTDDGDAVLDLVARGDLVFIEDVEADPMVRPTPGAGYRTVIAAAVAAGERPMGMLTVDAPRPGDLSLTDLELVRVLANLLASGLAQAVPRVG